MELHVIRKTENLRSGTSLHLIDQTCAFPESRTEHRMLQILFRLFSGGDPIPRRHWTVAKPSELREDEPHPVGLFPAGAQFPKDLFHHVFLRIDKTFQRVSIFISEHNGDPFEAVWTSLSRLPHLWFRKDQGTLEA